MLNQKDNPISLFFCGILSLSLLLLSSCKSSYPKEKLVQSVKDLCKSEYNIDVEAKIMHKTLGAQTHIDSLLNTDLTRTEEYKEVIEDIFLAIRRICISTNADINFFFISCEGQKLGYEAIMVGYLFDLRKIMVGGISRNDYFKRMMFDIRPSSKIFGQKRVKKLFSDMNTKKIDKIIGNNFVRGKTTLKDISSIFFLSLLELNMKDKVDYKITELKSLPISSDEALFYCKVREEYTAKKGFENKNFIFPNYFMNEYLIVITTKNFQVAIKKIYPLYKAGGEEKDDFPEQYKAYQDIEEWKETDFYVQDFTLPQFLADQIARRIKVEFTEKIYKTEETEKKEEKKEEKEPEKQKLPPLHVTGKSTNNNKTVELSFSWKKEFKEFSSQNIKDIAFENLRMVCNKYDFFKFEELKLLDITKNNEIGTIPINKSIFKKGNILQEAFRFSD